MQKILQPSLPVNKQVFLTKKDYLLISFISVSLALFSVPILQNVKLAFLNVNAVTIMSLMVFLLILANLGLWVASMIGKKVPVIFQFAKFGAVGAFNTLLDWGVLNTLIAITKIAGGTQYPVFKGISFSVAVISSYFWNKHWTFNSEKSGGESSEEFGRFILVSIIGLFLNVALSTTVVYLFGKNEIMSPERWANIGAVSATVISLVWNFIGYKLWVFKK